MLSAARSDRFTTGMHWVGMWLGPRASLDSAKMKMPPLSVIETRSSRS